PGLQSAHFLIPQVPGTVKRSKPVKGVVEAAFKAKKYMAPLLVWHPAIVGCFAAAYLTGSRGFDPGKHAMVFDLSRDLEPPMSAEEGNEYLARGELLAGGAAGGGNIPESKWPRLTAGATPSFDAAGRPLLQVQLGDTPMEVGLVRENILSGSEAPELAQHLLLVRLREELRRSAPGASESDVSNDLDLLQRLQHSRAALGSPLAGTF